MKLKVLSASSETTKDIELPKQFEEPVSAPLIKRAVLALQAGERQAYGADPRAGLQHSANVSRRRHDYRGAYGLGVSRVPRKVMSRRGTQMNWEGAEAPGTKGGRRAHPPKATKNWEQKINKKERRKAIRSALAATVDSELVSEHHKVPKNYPFVVDGKFESLSKTKDVKAALEKFNLSEELARVSKRTIRAGKGTMRSRRYRTKTGPLLVVSKESPLTKAARNIPGVEVTVVDSLNAQLLAPGREPGRLTIFTEDAITRIGKESLFV